MNFKLKNYIVSLKIVSIGFFFIRDVCKIIKEKYKQLSLTYQFGSINTM